MSERDDRNRDYRDTVFLPTTGFAMRGDLPQREPAILQAWAEGGQWARLRAARRGATPFILHDGPPFANGHLHIGHALNKILKDVINRAHQMAGFDARYIPGWDCHGLPIEWQIEEAYRKAGRDKDAVPVLEFRAECRAHAQHWMAVQAAEFQRLGVAGDWAARYATMDVGSEAAIVGEIGTFLLNGALYRGLRPVMWSPVEKTALAEAEIEYHDHTSTTIWVRFPVLSGVPVPASVVIWTTTPWTMPGNRAVACGAAIDYALIAVDAVDAVDAGEGPGAGGVVGEHLLCALALLPALLAAGGITAHHVVRLYSGAELVGSVLAHPLRGVAFATGGYDHDVPLLAGDFVTTEQGTGFVHIAPGHGEEDFALGRAAGLEVPDTVGPDGTFNAWVPGFAGVHVYKAAGPVCDALVAAGRLLARGTLVHSYPHSWRSKAPLITRATPQWFIRMDGPEQLRARALAAIDDTSFVPDAGRRRIGAMVAGRPDWCVSRQRSWGVPIAVFVDRRTGEPLRDPAVMARIVDAFAVEGADAWYRSPPSRFLGQERDAADYEQVMDIVDVWFESGASHAFALLARGLKWPADLYLEGSDQHRGWFQAALLEAVGTRGRAPFEAVLTHGFVLDEQGRKMSKSLGNVTAPQTVIDQAGADILRLWVMSSDTAQDLRIGPEIIRQQVELYRRLRNTLRWLLGSLHGFSAAEIVPDAQLPVLERWVLHRLSELDARLRAAIASHDWTGVYPAIHQFCAVDLSAFYFDVRKDAIYCDRPDSARRRAARTVLDQLMRCLTLWLAPVLVFTTEAAWRERFGPGASAGNRDSASASDRDSPGDSARDTDSDGAMERDSVHLQDLPVLPAGWRDDALAASWVEIRALRDTVTASLEALRRDKVIRAALEAEATLAPAAAAPLLSAPLLSTPLLSAPLLSSPGLSEEEWADLLIVSTVRFGAATAVARATGEKCARCWKILPEVGDDARHPTLCRRCVDAVESGLVGRAAA